MITVMDLVAHPVFREFRLASGQNGLYNPVLGTGIFEWETPDDIEKNFLPGEFVVTTLSCTKGDLTAGEALLKILINKGISGIGIKTVYFQEISDELKSYAELHRVPVFFFSNTFFDDIIFTIKSALHSNAITENQQVKLDRICQLEENQFLLVQTVKELNPYFFDKVICGYASHPAKDSHWKANDCLDSRETVYGKFSYQEGTLIVFTVKNQSTDLKGAFLQFLENMGIMSDTNRIGISGIHLGHENFGIAIKESIFANVSCRIDDTPLLHFQETGMDQMLIPVSDDPWVKRHCERIHGKIADYDGEHHTNLMETLFLYVECKGEVGLTARKSFQHANTIRYRLEKIKRILELEEQGDFYAQMVPFVRLAKRGRLKSEL